VYILHLPNLKSRDSVHTNHVVSESSKECGPICRPGKASTLRNLSILGLLRAESIDHYFGLEIPDLDGIVRGSTKPVTVGREAKSIDDLASVKGIEALSLVEIPEHCCVVFSATSSQ